MRELALLPPHAAAPCGVPARLRVLLLLLTLVVIPAPAYAHTHLTGAKPAAGARLTVAPRQLVLTFNEAPALAMSTLQLFGPDSTPVALGAPNHDAGVRTLAANITGPLVAGRYTVLWQTAGDDGHVQRGSYQFVIADGATGLAAVMAARAATQRDSATVAQAANLDSAVAPRNPVNFDASSPIYVIIRWVQFAALLLLIGAVTFRWWLLPRAGVLLEEPARLAMAAGAVSSALLGVWLLVESAAARLFAQAATLHGARHMADPQVLGPMLTSTAWGHGWVLEIALALVVVASLRPARRDVTAVMPWRLAAAAVAGLAFVPALSGHAVAERTFAPWTVLFDAAHVLAAGMWLGGLAVILFVGMPVIMRATRGGRHDALLAMLNAFSPLALTCASVLVFSGIVAARLHVGSWAAFTNTGYGRTLLIKLAVVLLLVATGAWNWRRAKPTLATEGDPGAQRLARSATFEVILALVVLLVTAVLVALPTPVEVVSALS